MAGFFAGKMFTGPYETKNPVKVAGARFK